MTLKTHLTRNNDFISNVIGVSNKDIYTIPDLENDLIAPNPRLRYSSIMIVTNEMGVLQQPPKFEILYYNQGFDVLYISWSFGECLSVCLCV